jgi:hypothetical protein
LTLPNTCSPTLQKQSNSFGVDLKYNLKAILHDEKGYLIKEEKINFNVGGYNLFHFQALKDPSYFSSLTRGKVKKMKFKQGEVEINLTLPKRILVRGENLTEVKVMVKNGTQKSIKKIKLSLDFHYKINSQEEFFKQEVLLKLPFEIGAKETKEICFDLSIPQKKNLPLSIHCKFSKIDIFLSALIVFGSLFTSNTKLSLPIILIPYNPLEDDFPAQTVLHSPKIEANQNELQIDLSEEEENSKLLVDTNTIKISLPSSKSLIGRKIKSNFSQEICSSIEEGIDFYDNSSEIPKSIIWKSNPNCFICDSKFSLLKLKKNCR